MLTDGFPDDPTGRDREPGGHTHLRGRIEELYEAALPGLAHSEPANGYRAIARLSGHLAAMRRAVLPVAGRHSSAAVPLVAACRAEGRNTEWALRKFECLLSGQSRAVRRAPASARDLLDQRLGHYRAAEHLMLVRLDGCLSPQEHERLAADYHAVLLTAPTRPHPRCPHVGPLAGVMFRLCAARDRVLDAVDSRPARHPISAE